MNIQYLLHIKTFNTHRECSWLDNELPCLSDLAKGEDNQLSSGPGWSHKVGFARPTEDEDKKQQIKADEIIIVATS